MAVRTASASMLDRGDVTAGDTRTAVAVRTVGDRRGIGRRCGGSHQTAVIGCAAMVSIDMVLEVIPVARMTVAAGTRCAQVMIYCCTPAVVTGFQRTVIRRVGMTQRTVADMGIGIGYDCLTVGRIMAGLTA